MKIALCLEYPIALRGGVSVLVETLAAEFSRHGHEVVLVSADPPGSLQNSEISRWLKNHFHWNPDQPTRKQARKLAEQLAAAGVELAHFHLGGTFGFGNRIPFRCPVYYLQQHGITCVTSVHLVVHLLDGFCGPQKPLWLKLLLLPMAWLGKLHQLFHVRAEIAVSRHDYEKLRRWYAPLRRRFVQIYHSRLRAADFSSTETARQKIILNVGHLARRKGQAVLAEAFAAIAARHPDWRLELAGKDLDGITSARIQQLAVAHQLEDRLLLLGERADVLALMRRASIYVQPSFEEALGLALQEAMACGCAVIGSRSGGIPELIAEEKLGLLVEAGNVPQLAAALETLINDDARRENLGRAAVRSIRERGMTVEQMTRAHLDLYEASLRKS